MKYYCKAKHPCQFVLPGMDGNYYCGEDNIGCSHKEIKPVSDTEGENENE